MFAGRLNFFLLTKNITRTVSKNNNNSNKNRNQKPNIAVPCRSVP